jgi:hypothetical protein
MIPEIGIMLGLYILTRVIPSGRRRLAAILSVATGLVAILVVADLAARSFPWSAASSFLRRPEPRAVVTPPSPAADNEPKAASAVVTRADGGSITTDLGYGIAVAKGSSLRREWIAVHVPALPVDLDGTPGVSTVYVRKEYSGEYNYRAKFRINTTQPIKAIEVRFLTFDVWGNHVRTLSSEDVVDIAAGVTKELQGSWSLYSENDVERHYASIAFIARIRLEDGHVLVAPTDAVVEEARKFSTKFTVAELDPKSPSPSGTPPQGSGT